MPTFDFHDYSLNFILIASSLLLIISVLASRISSTFGVPSLLLFLGIGMLAGSEGPGGIAFEDYKLAFAVGSVCLSLIMFDGGMRTSWRSVRPILGLGISLSIVGTVVTGAATGIFSRYALGLSWLESMLLGAIVSSTDAAAVFSILRARGVTLKGTLKQSLEFEAGSNDPVAIFLTMGVLSLATAKGGGVASLLLLFLTQAGLGLVLGLAGGAAIRWLINHVGIEFEGLYGVLLTGLVVCLFACTSAIGGSGFLAVYVAGVYLGKSEILHRGSMSRFLDGVAWIAQILVFLTLGLLVFPSHLLPHWREGLILALFMMFVARPLGVWLATPGSGLGKRERVFVSWVGLRGAAPIILATLPWSVGFPNAEYYFNLVFFVVLLSVMFQGITIPWVARKVGVTEQFQAEPAAELSAGLLPAGVISVEIEVVEASNAVGKRIVDLQLPQGVLLTSLEREQRYLVPRGDTILSPGDRIRGLAQPGNVNALKNLFGEANAVS
jgi:potassium/hydrogen antiporter